MGTKDIDSIERRGNIQAPYHPIDCSVRRLYKVGESIDHASEMLPPASPEVITTRRVPRAPCPTIHLIDVSDSHSVASHPVLPKRDCIERLDRPILRP